MKRRIFKQRLLVLTGSNTSDEVTSAMEEWCDTEDSRFLVVYARLVHKTGPATTALYIETAATENGPWESVSVTASGKVVFAAEDSATNVLQRFVRWRVVGGQSDWAICFALDGNTKN
jgi:hypothetical protein